MRKRKSYKKRARVAPKTKTRTIIKYRTVGAKAKPRRRKKAVYRSTLGPVVAHKRKTFRRVNGSIFGQTFNAKNFIIKSAVGGIGGLGLKYVAEMAQEKFAIFDPWQKFGLNMLIGVGLPLALRKNKKALAYVLPASFAFTGASIIEMKDTFMGLTGTMAGGTRLMNGGTSLLNGGTSYLGGPVNVNSRMAPSSSNFDSNQF